MKVKELIKLLSGMDPDSDVEYCTANGSSSGYIEDASEQFDKTVCLDARETHLFGEEWDKGNES
ncbi:hypothetical protein [Leptospira noguchii]|uniref:hypothetical protein n=1 Tax=Leptospira noguchii TaxID=28182 RepID=UPI0007735A13|nr:hypothetical protein [Leptospira noguchii]